MFALEKDTRLAIQVTDAFGNVILNEDLALLKGVNHFEWNCQSIPAGVYLVTLTGDEFNHVEKVMVQ